MTELRPTPVEEGRRVAALDAARGVAVLGILAMNLVSFGMVDAAYLTPGLGTGGLGGLNGVAWTAQRALIDQRFMAIFAMLFGVGVLLMSRRTPVTTHVRRMLALLGIGLLHGYGLWHGDVLALYAVLGLLVVLAVDLPPATLLKAAAGLIAGGWVLLLLGGLLGWAAVRAVGDPAPAFGITEAALAAQREVMGGGSFAEVAAYRAGLTLQTQLGSLIFYGPRTAGLMLLGMALWKLDLFHDAGRRTRRVLLGVGLLAGGPLTALDLWLGWRHGWGVLWSNTAGLQTNYWASVLVAPAYLALMAGLFRRVRPRPLEAVGRLALTNYLAQSLLCTTFFYGYGLGRFGTLDRAGLLLLTGPLWAAQLAWSPLWLRSFKQGPAERAWRRLTYGRGVAGVGGGGGGGLTTRR